MQMQTRYLLFQLFLGLVALFNGCIFLPSFMHPGYGGKVVAQITPQNVDSIDAAVLALGDFEGPREIEGGDPRRKYYTKQLSKRNVQVSFSLYAGPLNESATGWGYAVYVMNWDQGRDEKVRAEIDLLLERARAIIQAHVGDAKVTVETYRFSPP